MNTHATYKTQENKRHAAASKLSKKPGNGESPFRFPGNHPKEIAQRKLHEAINNSPRVQQLRNYQEMANNSPKASQLKAIQAVADDYTSQTTQRKENLAKEIIQQKFETGGAEENKKGFLHNLHREADVTGTQAFQIKMETAKETALLKDNEVAQQKSMAHNKGCGCAGCLKTSGSNPGLFVPALSSPAQLTPVIQGKWKCTNCDAEGEGKPKSKCPECGQKTLEEVAEGRAQFGTWWESLSGERRQELLRAHGSHEAEGGAVTKKNQGGGGKGNQHSDGVARAMAQIRVKYDSGKLNE